MFEELDLDRRLQLGLEGLGLETPTEVQRLMLPAALAGGDLKVRAETGSGKTLAYLLPLAQRILSTPPSRDSGTLALVLVPTRELARQVLRDARTLLAKAGTDVQGITGGADFKYQRSLFRRNPEILVATPGRLREHCEKGSADLKSLQTLVLDEADRMLEMGFREDVLEIASHCASARHTWLLSATLKRKGMSEISAALLDQPATISVGEVREAHSTIRHQRILADSDSHKDALLAGLLKAGGFRRALVFANRRSTATRLSQMLAGQDLRCAELHGDLSTEERKQVMARFGGGSVDIVCASDLAARGLDVAGIDLVVNYELPRNGDDYLHRSGRTGRAGEAGLAVSLVGSADWNRMIGIARYLKIEFEARTLEGLKAKFKGPKNRKSSGKAAGSKKRKKDPQAKARSRHRNRKNQGKPNPAARTGPGDGGDGFAPLMKKKPPVSVDD